jgi:hypothetical protein
MMMNEEENNNNDNKAPTSSSSESSSAGFDLDAYDLYGKATPYQSHVVSVMSPFMGFNQNPVGMSLHSSPGIFRIKANIFSPGASLPEMTPVRPGDLKDLHSPSVAAFFQTPNRVDQQQHGAIPWMTPQKREGNLTAMPLPKPNIVPVNQTLRRQLHAINQKNKESNKNISQSGQQHEGGSSGIGSTPQTPLSALPPVTLFNGIRDTHPAEEALRCLRKSDKAPVFDQASRFLSKKRKFEELIISDLLTVASAALEPPGPQSAVEMFSPISIMNE